MYVPRNQGKIREISGLDDPPFSNKRFVDPDFLIDYDGTGSGSQSWRYQPESEPVCPTRADADAMEEEPQLTNEPEGAAQFAATK